MRRTTALFLGAQRKRAEGLIRDDEASEIASIVKEAEFPDFQPLIFVIPYPLVNEKLKGVPVSQRAHPMSVEFIIDGLPRTCFDVLKLDWKL